MRSSVFWVSLISVMLADQPRENSQRLHLQPSAIEILRLRECCASCSTHFAQDDKLAIFSRPLVQQRRLGFPSLDFPSEAELRILSARQSAMLAEQSRENSQRLYPQLRRNRDPLRQAQGRLSTA